MDFPYKEGNTPYIHVEDEEAFTTFFFLIPRKFGGELEFTDTLWSQITQTRAIPM